MYAFDKGSGQSTSLPDLLEKRTEFLESGGDRGKSGPAGAAGAGRDAQECTFARVVGRGGDGSWDYPVGPCAIRRAPCAGTIRLGRAVEERKLGRAVGKRNLTSAAGKRFSMAGAQYLGGGVGPLVVGLLSCAKVPQKGLRRAKRGVQNTGQTNANSRKSKNPQNSPPPRPPLDPPRPPNSPPRDNSPDSWSAVWPQSDQGLRTTLCPWCGQISEGGEKSSRQLQTLAAAPVVSPMVALGSSRPCLRPVRLRAVMFTGPAPARLSCRPRDHLPRVPRGALQPNPSLAHETGPEGRVAEGAAPALADAPATYSETPTKWIFSATSSPHEESKQHNPPHFHETVGRIFIFKLFQKKSSFFKDAFRPPYQHPPVRQPRN